jgi:heme-degrading monooxygenase HmoA
MVRIPIGSTRDAESLEDRFRSRLDLAEGQPGFLGFELLKGRDEYISVTRWATRADLDSWMRSQAHSEAHGHTPHPTGGGHPHSESRTPQRPLPNESEADSALRAPHSALGSASTMIYEVIIPGKEGS